MAIIYNIQIAGSYIAYGLSTDTKPSSPFAGCMFFETDTAKTYKVVSGNWTESTSSSYQTSGTIADTSRISFTKPAGTAVVDQGIITINAIIRSIGAAGIGVGIFNMTHNLQITGHAITPSVTLTTISAGFDMTVANLIAGVCITTGAADAITIQLVQAEAWNI